MQVLWACETEHPQQTLVFTKPLVSQTWFRSLLSPPLLVAFVVEILSWMRWKCYCQKTATPVALLTTTLMMSWVGNKTNQGIQQPWYPKKDIRFVLTYLGLQSKIITKQLKACINKFYGCIDLRVIFHNTYRIKSLKRPKLYKANCWTVRISTLAKPNGDCMTEKLNTSRQSSAHHQSTFPHFWKLGTKSTRF